MRHFVKIVNGYQIWKWSTGKIEAYKDGVPAGYGNTNFVDVEAWCLDH